MVFVLCYNHSVTGSSPFSPTSSCLHPLGVVGLSYSWTILLFSVILYPFVPILSFFPLDFLRCFKYLCVVFSYLWLCNFFCNFFFYEEMYSYIFKFNQWCEKYSGFTLSPFMNVFLKLSSSLRTKLYLQTS